MYRRLEIEAVANGFVASVGCQRLVYTGESREIAAKRLCVDLEAYLIDPYAAERDGVKKCFNLQHTMLGPQPIGPPGDCCGAAMPDCPPPATACCRETDGPRVREVGRGTALSRHGTTTQPVQANRHELVLT